MAPLASVSETRVSRSPPPPNAPASAWDQRASNQTNETPSRKGLCPLFANRTSRSSQRSSGTSESSRRTSVSLHSSRKSQLKRQPSIDEINASIANARAYQRQREAEAEPEPEIEIQVASTPPPRKSNEEYKKLISSVRLFREMGDEEIESVVSAIEVRAFRRGQVIYDEGDQGRECWLVDTGVVFASKYVFSIVNAGKKIWRELPRYYDGAGFEPMFGERELLRSEPRQSRMTCRTDVVALRITAEAYTACARILERKENLIRAIKIFEGMTDNEVGKIAAVIKRQHYKDGENIATAGEPGTACFLLVEGQATSTTKTGVTKSWQAGELFGEQALKEGAPCDATLVAAGDVTLYVLTREAFESKLKPLEQMLAEQYEADPRKLLNDFYRGGDVRGSAGTLAFHGLAPDPSRATSWFAVYRPCSRDSIAKMLGGVGVGKGLNIKGKSSKKNRLSGYVPFLQISDNNHKKDIGESPKAARIMIYYRNILSRDVALNELTKIMRESHELQIDEREIRNIRTYEPKAFGLDVPEPVITEAYIQRPDISPVVGWETGRPSEPAFMDANLRSLRGGSSPSVCLYQLDLADCMNPLGLLIAYAEKFVKPVISDFDTFLVGNRGMQYTQPVPPEQVKLIHWALDHTAAVLGDPNSMGWMGRWLQVLKAEDERGFHPDLPKFGFGDPLSYKLIGDVVDVTQACGAVRHGAECFNYYFPQELDDELLVIWEGFSNPPWRAFKEPELRQFLLERIKDGYSFPLNPVWPVRDPGWHEVLQALRANHEAASNLKAWFPTDSGVNARIDEIHAAHPKGFVRV